MQSLRGKFIEDNRIAFEVYLEKASDKILPVSGLGILSPKECLKNILEDNDNFYLPLAFIHIFLEFENSEDRSFVLNSLKCLSDVELEGKVADPFIAYVYAYCLWRSGDEDGHYAQLQKLTAQCFMPALVTMGDACIANYAINECLDWYTHAINHGYLMVTPRYNKLVLKDKNFLKTLPQRILTKLDIIYRLFQVSRRGMKGEHALYLDFYDIKRQLNKYWAIPKAERVKRLSEQV